MPTSHELSPIQPAPVPAAMPVPPPAPVSYGQPRHDDDDEIDLRAAWTVVRRRWKLILACFVAAVAAGWFFTARMTPVYQATATLRIAEKEAAVPGLEVLKQLAGGETEVSTEMEVLRSRALAEHVVERLGLRLMVAKPARLPRSSVIAEIEVSDAAPAREYRFTRQADSTFQITQRDTAFHLMPRRGTEAVVGKVSPGGEVGLPGVVVQLTNEAKLQDEFVLKVLTRNGAIDALQEELTVSRPNRDANIISVRHRGPDPELVQAVPTVLVHGFIERRKGLRKTAARSAVEFLRGQLDTLSRQVRRVEDSLRTFREAEQVVSLQDEAGAQVQRLAELQAQRTDVNGERAALERLVADANAAQAAPGQPSPFRRLLAFPTLLKNQATAALLSSLITLDNQRADLLLRRKPKDPDVVALNANIRELEGQVRAVVQTYLDGLRQQVASLDASLAGFEGRLKKIPAKEVHFARLQRSNQVLTEIYTLLQTRLKESEIAQAVEDPSAQVVDEAFQPELPVAPRRGLNLLLAGFLGLGLGLTGAFGREWLDTTVHSRDDIQAATGVSVLGIIPHIRDARAKYRFARRQKAPAIGLREAGMSLALAAGRDLQGPVSEAYRALRTNLAFVRPERPPKTIAFTSAAPEDGKSTSVANLAATLAQQGLKVLVIDADMRRGTLHRVFAGVREPGLSELLVGRAELEAAIQDVDLGPSGRVHLIAGGPPPPNPAELLASNRLRQLLDRLEPHYDAILLDCPPVNIVTDAAVVGTQADGVLVVARAGKTQRAELAFSVEQLRTVRVSVLGAVLNDFELKRDASSGGGYYAGRYDYAAVSS
jgi:capsular exopolysaccharide synthesis family protein